MRKKNVREIILGSAAVWGLPLLTLAATFDTVLTNIRGWMNTIISLLFVLVTLYFIWGIVEYVKATSDDTKIKGRQHMIWGIIGMAVMAAAWGIVRMIIDSFGVGGSSIPVAPGF